MFGCSGGSGGMPGRGGGGGGMPGRDGGGGGMSGCSGGGGGMPDRGGGNGGKPFAGVNFKLVGFDHRQEEQMVAATQDQQWHRKEEQGQRRESPRTGFARTFSQKKAISHASDHSNDDKLANHASEAKPTHLAEGDLQLTLENAGAAHALVQTSGIKCTHLIVCSNSIAYHNEWCEKGRNNGLHVLNELWIRDSLQLGRPASVMNVRYRPKIGLNGVKGAEKMIICCQGYPDQFMKIQDIATLIGAQLYPGLRPETTHFMSYKQEGLDYQNAIKQGVAIINITWLADCLSEWKICPPKGNMESDYIIDSQRRFHSHGNKFLTPSPKAASARSRRLL
ncbi:hypothetical protein ACQ4PT_040667 [Festuca glaucescens]